jgi:nucleoside-diphosphate-sugar epimerase
MSSWGKIAITGACSTIARSVISLLDKDDRVKSILALDIRPYDGVPSAKIQYQKVDVRDIEALRHAFKEIDAVVHLAFIVVTRVTHEPEIFAINIEGSKNVAQAAADSGVKRLVYTSSVAAYGFLPENPPLLTEDMPIRGERNRNNYYPYTKAVVDKFMEDYAETHPRLIITRFRSHLVTGPNIYRYTKNLMFVPDLTRSSKSYWGFRPEGVNGGRLQFTHEEDLAKAIQFALHHPMPGAYNIAGEPMDLERYLRENGKKFRRIPRRAVSGLISVLSPFSARLRLARSWMIGARYRNIMDCSKLKRAGFAERLRTSRECLQEANAYFAQKRGQNSTEACLSGPGMEDSIKGGKDEK